MLKRKIPSFRWLIVPLRFSLLDFRENVESAFTVRVAVESELFEIWGEFSLQCGGSGHSASTFLEYVFAFEAHGWLVCCPYSHKVFGGEVGLGEHALEQVAHDAASVSSEYVFEVERFGLSRLAVKTEMMATAIVMNFFFISRSYVL